MDPDHKSAAAMRENHLQMSALAEAQLDALPLASPASFLEMEWEDVQKALKGFTTASAGGCTGLRPSHLRSAMVPPWQTELVRQLIDVGNLMLKGSIPADIRPYLCGAKLAALPKVSGVGWLRRKAVGGPLSIFARPPQHGSETSSGPS